MVIGDGNRSPLEWGAIDGESPVGEAHGPMAVEFLSNARVRGIGREAGGTTLQGERLPCDR